MQNYTDVLNAVAEKEFASVILISIVAALLVVFIWTFIFLYYRKQMKKHLKLYVSDKQRKDRHKAIWACIAVSIICIGLSALVNLDTLNTIEEIKMDISDNSYITYTGEYIITYGITSKHELYDKWISVDFDNGDFAFLYMDNFKEYLQLDEGRYDGKVIYGENSLIVVDIKE